MRCNLFCFKMNLTKPMAHLITTTEANLVLNNPSNIPLNDVPVNQSRQLAISNSECNAKKEMSFPD